MDTLSLEEVTRRLVNTSGRAFRYLLQAACVLAVVAVFAFGAPDHSNDDLLNIDAHAEGTSEVTSLAAE